MMTMMVINMKTVHLHFFSDVLAFASLDAASKLVMLLM